jgi:hypothetical protein
MSGPSVTIDLTDYDKLRNERQAALEEGARLRAEIVETKLGDLDSETRKAVAVARAAIEVARYAMGNLSPEFAKHWPYDDLRKLADAMDVMPSSGINDHDLAHEMRHFARDCETWERNRATKTMRDEAERIEKMNLARLADLAGSIETKAQTDPDQIERVKDRVKEAVGALFPNGESID